MTSSPTVDFYYHKKKRKVTLRRDDISMQLSNSTLIVRYFCTLN